MTATVAQVPEAYTSAQAEIDRQLEDLIRKIIKGVATEQEESLYQELAARRVRLMNPTIAKIDRLLAERRLRRYGE